jgi:hypothetical protein
LDGLLLRYLYWLHEQKKLAMLLLGQEEEEEGGDRIALLHTHRENSVMQVEEGMVALVGRCALA